MFLTGVWSDPASWLSGLVRVVTRRAAGFPRPNETGHRLLQDAEQVRYIPEQLAALIERNPGYPQALLQYAAVLAEDGKWAEVLTTAEALQRSFPDYVQGYIHGCTALRRLGRSEEAERQAKRIMLRFPRAQSAFEAYAFCASDRADWPEAERRWAMVVRRFPAGTWPRIMRSNALFLIGRVAEADRILTEAVQAWPDDWMVWLYYADLAARAEDWPEAVNRWRAARDRFAGRAEPHARLTEAQVKAGTIAEAEATIAQASFLYPRDAAVLEARRKVAAAGGDPGPLPE